MPPIGALDTVTVVGKYTFLDGTVPGSGTVTFSATVRLREPTPQIILPAPITANLDEDGEFAVELPATDDPDVTPTGFTYQVKERITGPGTQTSGANYNIAVPLNTPGGILNLADAAPTQATSPSASYVLSSVFNALESRVDDLEESGPGGGGPHNDADHADAFLALSGGPLTGPLTLPGDATAALQAVPRRQLDASLAGAVGAGYVRLVGDEVSTSYPIPHNLGVEWPSVWAYNVATGALISNLVATKVDADNLVVTFEDPPGLNQMAVAVGAFGVATTGGGSGAPGEQMLDESGGQMLDENGEPLEMEA